MEKQLEPGGERARSRAAVLFSHGDRLGSTGLERHIESEGEPLRRLVEACGNRYHVLDNKQRWDGAQVAELIDLTEEILAEERPVVLHRQDRLWEPIPSAREQQPEAAGRSGYEEFLEFMIHRRQLSRGLSESASCPALNCSEGPDAAAQIQALSPGRAGRLAGRTLTDRDGFMSRLASQGLKWATAAHTSHSQAHPFSPTRLLVEERVTLRRLSGSGGLQALTGQWGDSSLEELEAFIDSYFEAVWEQAVGSRHPPRSGRFAVEQGAAVEVPEEEEALASITRKLTTLELLEEIRRDVAKLRESLEHMGSHRGT